MITTIKQSKEEIKPPALPALYINNQYNYIVLVTEIQKSSAFGTIIYMKNSYSGLKVGDILNNKEFCFELAQLMPLPSGFTVELKQE